MAAKLLDLLIVKLSEMGYMVNKIVVLVAVLVLAVLGAVLLRNSGTQQTLNGTPSATNYVFQPGIVTSASGKYTLIDAHFLPGSVAGTYPGVQYTALSDMVNTTVYNNNGNSLSTSVPLNVPIQVYSIVYVCNTTQAAQSVFQAYSAKWSGVSGVTSQSIPQIGDKSGAFSAQGQNSSLMILQFTYHNVYAKVGVYYPLGSNTTSISVSLAQALLQTIKNGALTK